MGTLAIESNKYARVLAKVLPRVITNEVEQHERTLAVIEMLIYLMDQRGLKQVDLLRIFKSSGYVSDVVNGKRAISKAHARELASFFKVSADVFI